MRIGIAGLGLIGGSLALALRDAHTVVGWSPSAATRAQAAAAGLAVVATREALLPADVVVVSAPLAEVVPVLAALAPIAGSTVLLDVGSLKVPVAEYAAHAPAGARIVGGHPMAGSTATGFAAADAALFRGRPFLLTPTARSDEASLALCGALARAAGGVVTVLAPAVHDRILAALSAAPLAVAVALAHAGREIAGTAVASLAGPGFRDTTRLAATPASLAVPMLAGNAANVRAALARVRAALDALDAALATGDAGAVEDALAALRTEPPA